MTSLQILKVLVRELITSERAIRIPEPDLVMDRAEQVEAYTTAGAEGGTMAPVYLFHTTQISQVLRPGDTVVDLACGSANQLAQVARLNPDVHFLGIDLSPTMLARARQLTTEKSLANCEFRLASITDLGFLENRSVDAVISTLAFHHLPDAASLQASFREAGRVLKPDGGVYFADLGHLRAEKSIEYFGRQYADRQPEIFTVDYLNSLRAAFSLHDFKLAAQAFGGQLAVMSTFLVPYMIVVKSAARRPPDERLARALRALRQSLPDHHRSDLKDLILFFRAGGLATPYLG
ncbi:MAG: class I SAM-dependent methyltransferase [Candidatus Accumulibacter phosphatis]|uniref:Class I SAM-dependent methyltransferase n=1 Tax=Candidatus Thiothrix phosphatis TaxID=3112415 RepID=A0ABU6CV69_9GAMM|nr:class I SAM-dependent methyltransferase [Candidatus Thiothrix sp. Deng01]MCQ1549065.1 class I SAM-dependent methyltransferase [Candidatus Accumulibacter phosphatis]MEB4590741.1 class I SAM-dependent methyltransferase [Candidatus Thiothrix sp. Deng01]